MSRSRRSAETSWLVVVLASLGLAGTAAAEVTRTSLALDTGWRTTLATPVDTSAECATPTFDDSSWRRLDIPHNWDAYAGATLARHGNLHGSAWYRRAFSVSPADLADGRRAFLFFEGVGSFATVWVNGREVGRHAGGLTTFTLDITAAVRTDIPNTLAVRADHPAGIRDLPWVCGGCEFVTGFSEGPQPFGIFRPVSLVFTAPVRVEPFGVHIWNDTTADETAAPVHSRTEIRNYGTTPRKLTVVTRIHDADGTLVAESRRDEIFEPGKVRTLEGNFTAIGRPRLWSPDNPHLYRAITELFDGAAIVDRVETPFGIRTIHWPAPDGPADQPFLVNGRPVFLNGTCDYEHNLGASHAFSDEQIAARVAQIRAAGFNAFRDAHHPHNLRFNTAWDRAGLLWWTQFGAQIWFDRDDFRTNFKTLLREWVRERRNSPSLVLWGLQNESKLPAAFAAECAAIIREMDPTASSQRLITTCNGGTGTDWNVPQNWTGTYGGDPLTYADDLRRQRLVGEYGGWRSLGLHAEAGGGLRSPPSASAATGNASPSMIAAGNGVPALPALPLSEDRLNALLETKIRLAESVRDQVAGHFHWPFTTHANPGRTFGENGEQLFDGIRPLDQVGPANNKGLFTLWGEPTDAYHLYRANFIDGATHPMIAIMSHTWPDRWTEPGRRSGIIVYSNCDEVELFNDLGARSLGVRTRTGRGTHFQWDDVPIEFNLLHAEGRISGKIVATDAILLHHLPAAPAYTAHDLAEPDLLAPAPDSTYLHRVNCGGPDYLDHHGNLWAADRDVSTSWASAYPHLPAELGSQRKLYEPITGTRDDALFQTFRYGRDQLRTTFTVSPGDYEVDLFFTEPWYLAGGGADCTGWRLFDIALNGAIVLRDLDIWKETGGHARALKKTIPATVTGQHLEISFPRVAAGQAIISAIAVRTSAPAAANKIAARPAHSVSLHTHLDLGDPVYSDSETTLATLPPTLLEATLVRTPEAAATNSTEKLVNLPLDAGSNVLIAHDASITSKPAWLTGWERTGERVTTAGPHAATFDLYRRHVATATTLPLGPNLASPGRGSMYFAIVQHTRPLPAPQFVEQLTTPFAGGWTAHGHCKSGQPQYTDRTTSFLALPAALGDADWIRTSHADAGSIAATFTTASHTEVCVALDARITTPPAWLREWIPTTWVITTSDSAGGRFSVWRRRFSPGQTTTLGANAALPDESAAAMYSVFVRPVRPSAIFAAQPIDATNTVWTISVSVGDRYGLNFRYREDTPSSISASYSISASDGATVCTGAFEIPPAPDPAGWSIARARTCASLNAGTYVLRVTVPSGSPRISLDTLEVE